MKSRSAWFENGTEKARKLKKENSKRLIKSAILGNADTKRRAPKGCPFFVVYPYGATKDRAEQVKDFQENPDVKVFVGQLQTTGMGLTLTAASVAVFYSLDFSYANYVQSRARIHRIGQKEKCLYIHLVAKNTVDEKIMNALKHKGDIAKLMVDNWRTLLHGKV